MSESSMSESPMSFEQLLVEFGTLKATVDQQLCLDQLVISYYLGHIQVTSHLLVPLSSFWSRCGVEGNAVEQTRTPPAKGDADSQ